MGQALGRALREAGEAVCAVASRSREHARQAAEFIGGVAAVDYSELSGFADRILIAVPDDAVEAVAAALGRRCALHTSGARGPVGVAGALHPMQTIAAPQEYRALRGAYFGVTAEGEALAWAGRIVALLDGRMLRIAPERRALYHAAGVMASNYMVAVIDAAERLMQDAGGEREALAPILRASVENCIRMGAVAALTGPLERGDAGTIRSHLAAMDGGVRDLYRAAGKYLVTVARRRAAPAPNLDEMEALFGESNE